MLHLEWRQPEVGEEGRAEGIAHVAGAGDSRPCRCRPSAMPVSPRCPLHHPLDPCRQTFLLPPQDHGQASPQPAVEVLEDALCLGPSGASDPASDEPFTVNVNRCTGLRAMRRRGPLWRTLSRLSDIQLGAAIAGESCG
jgi:hypothetical protein